MTPEEILQIRTVCRFCSKRFRYLGSHVAQKHLISAREYKQEIGIELWIPLTDPDLEELQKRRCAEHFDRDKFLAIGAASRFQRGESRPRYVSKQFRENLAVMTSTPVARICCKCQAEFIAPPRFKKCPACREATANDRAGRAETMRLWRIKRGPAYVEYMRNWTRARRAKLAAQKTTLPIAA